MNSLLEISNKELLWSLMQEDKLFTNIPFENLNELKNIFEKKLIEIGNLNNKKSLMELNKLVLIDMKSVMNNYKKSIGINIEKESHNFDKKKQEFESLFKKDIPDNIEFNDEIDRPIDIDEMNKMLESTIKSRNIEIERNEDKEINNNVTEKKVTFKEDKNDFFEKLKKKEVNNFKDNNFNTILERLDEINKKLDKILNN